MKIIEIKSINTDTRKLGAVTKYDRDLYDLAFIESLVVNVKMDLDLLEYCKLLAWLESPDDVRLDGRYVECCIFDNEYDDKLSSFLGGIQGRVRLNSLIEKEIKRFREDGIGTIPIGFTRYRVSARFRGESVSFLYGGEDVLASVKFSEGWRDLFKRGLEKLLIGIYDAPDFGCTAVLPSRLNPKNSSRRFDLVAIGTDIRWITINGDSDVYSKNKLRKFKIHYEQGFQDRVDLYFICEVNYASMPKIMTSPVVDLLAVSDIDNASVGDDSFYPKVDSGYYSNILKNLAKCSAEDNLSTLLSPISKLMLALVRVKIRAINSVFDGSTQAVMDTALKVSKIFGDDMYDFIKTMGNCGWFYNGDMPAD